MKRDLKMIEIARHKKNQLNYFYELEHAENNTKCILLL